MTSEEAEALLAELATVWVADPDHPATWTGTHDGRRGLRVSQDCRDATTIWFHVGQRTVAVEAFLLPDPGTVEAYRYCLRRAASSWPLAYALDAHGDLVVRTRIPLDVLGPETLDLVMGVVWEQVEIAFPRLVREKIPSERPPQGSCAQPPVDGGGHVENPVNPEPG